MSCNDEFLSLVASYPSSAEIREVNLFLDSPSEIRSFFSSMKFDFDRLSADIINTEISGPAPFWKTSIHSDTCTIFISDNFHDLHFSGELSFEFHYDEDSDLPSSLDLISLDVDISLRYIL